MTTPSVEQIECADRLAALADRVLILLARHQSIMDEVADIHDESRRITRKMKSVVNAR